VVNSKIKEQLLLYKVPENKIRIINNGIDFNLLNNVLDNTKKEYDAVFVGRLMHHKGILDLVEIWSKVVKKIPEAKIAILGNGEKYYLEQIKKKIIQHKLEKSFLLLGFIDGNGKYKIMKKSKMLILPSYLEGKPNVFNEAMACKLPVVTYELDYYKEFYGNLLNYVRKGDKEKFAQKIISLLNNKNMRLKQGRANGDFINKYSWQNVITTNLSYIEAIL